MSVINKIREKSGWAVGFIGVSITLFVLGDLFGNNTLFGGGNNQTLGEIDGKEINIQDFQARMDVMRQNYEAQTGRAAGEQELTALREQAWNQMIIDIAYKKQYDKLGLTVTDEEKTDMVQGNNISPAIQQAFANPTTGAFDKSAVVNYLKNLKTLPLPQQQSWADFEKNLYADRLRQKYEGIIQMSSYVTKAEAEKEYMAQNTKANLRYLYVPFYSVPDTTIKVTDSQLSSYLKDHKDEYKGMDTRTIQYVTFPVVPNTEDSATLNTEIKNLARGLASAANDSAYARMNSDIAVPTTMSYANMSDQLKEAVTTFVPGGVYGPYREGDTYFIYKYGGTRKDSLSTVRASHILISFENPSDSAKAVARQKAEGILNQLRGGASFEALAATNSTDQGSAQRGGDLGYFQNNGGMVKPFEDAVFSHSGTGLIPRLVESQFGYHIIKVTDAKSNTLYRLATIAKTIAPSQATRDDAYRKADQFAASVDNKEEFDEAVAKDKSLVIATATRIPENANNVNAIQNAREIVRWAFNDKTGLNKVSQVFETDDQYVVAVLTGKTDADDVKVDDFRDELTAKVRNQLKAEQIISKLGTVSDLEAAAKKYGAGALVETADDITLATGLLSSAGFDPYALGKGFGSKKGQKTKPFAGENGVFVMEQLSKTPAPQIADYTPYKSQIQQNIESRASFLLNEAVRDNANIVDRRAKFF
ncbi:peptidylprolyl isomerase [Persicitalea jodogahamensis]|uniref:Periplasmic chaperone PpiD n=1 Tax=Persicitalea jodogahamensis TaxID=402147 RepID=A0A8J3G8M6_9BACT|nr:peptidylprolyl isomerase [Persicitalea jodogahamensis]GHB67758.1 peptidylprolyl isomerase [Persicitalea jodogahamensis]